MEAAPRQQTPESDPVVVFNEFKHRDEAVGEQPLAPGPLEEYPVRALVRQERVPVNVYWAP